MKKKIKEIMKYGAAAYNRSVSGFAAIGSGGKAHGGKPVQ
jgi:hypothetical protein